MILRHQASHPSARSYVLKLHHDAAPGRGAFFGRVEHIPTGEAAEFDSVEALVDWLARHVEGLEGAASV